MIYSLLSFILFTSAFFPQIIPNQYQPKNEFKFKNQRAIQLSSSKFKMNKLRTITFSPFRLGDFNIKANEIIKLKNGKSISSSKFLEEINNIEQKLNEWGYSLRDKYDEVVLGELVYPHQLLSEQRKIIESSSSNILPDNTIITPCGILSEESIESAIKYGVPQELWPINFKREWSALFGNENLGIDINHYFFLDGEEKSSNLFASGETKSEIILTIFNEKISAMRLIDKLSSQPLQNHITAYILNDKAIDDNLKSAVKKTYSENLSWETAIELSLGPFDLEGIFNLTGKVGITKSFLPFSLKVIEDLTPFLDLDISGNLNIGVEVAEAGIEGKVKMIDNKMSFSRTLELKKPGKHGYFIYNSKANNNLKALIGHIYAYIKIDYLIGSKKYLLAIYNSHGVSSVQNIFALNFSQPARRDRNLWLEITKISGITTYTARNEKINVLPKSFEITVDAAGQSLSEVISDWNNDGIIETPVRFKLPLLSSLRIPITISVKERYKIGDLLFNSNLDLMQGELKDLSICYDPITKEIFGSIKGKEEQELVSTGDSNFFGERNHSIKFKLTPSLSLKGTSPKAK